MSSKIVRSSKYRHIYGQGSKKELCYDGMMVSLDSNDGHLIKANTKFMSIHWDCAGGGSFLLHRMSETGRIAPNPSLCSGHSGPVLDTDFHPFNEFVLASAGEDGRILLWNINDDDGGVKGVIGGELLGHERRIVDLKWHPSAEGILASASHDMTVRLWNVEAGKCFSILEGHADAVLDQGWSAMGDMLATSSKDKSLRIFDPRSKAVVGERKQAHAGVKGIRIVWLESDQIVTTGFSGRSSEREMALWDIRKLDDALTVNSIDSASGPLLPYFDGDSNLLYVAGRGDGNIRTYEMLPSAPYFYNVAEYRSSDPQRGLAMLPKRALLAGENEVTRFLKVYGSQHIVEPISFRVPRRDAGSFQSDLFPPVISGDAAMTADAWLDGGNELPKRIGWEGILGGMAVSNEKKTEIHIANTNSNSNGNGISKEKVPDSAEEWQRAWKELSNDMESLKNEVTQKNVRIRQLEALLNQQQNQ